MSNLRRLGSAAEDRAAEYLLGKGYTVVTRRYKTRRGEIDIIALDGEEIVFVEVKLRQTAGYSAEEAVGVRKLKSLVEAGDAYLVATGGLDRPHRYDLIAIDREGIRHHERAF